MIFFVLSLSALLILGIAIYLWYGPSNEPIQQPRPDGCCGQHAVCEKESLLAAMSKDIVYYDDEELDRYRCTEPNAYTEEQTEEFREILSTMKESDVPGWIRSLQLRHIEIPEALRDDILLIVGDLRSAQ